MTGHITVISQSVTLSCVTQIRQDILVITYQSVILLVLCYDRTPHCHQSVCRIVQCYTDMTGHTNQSVILCILYYSCVSLSHCPMLHSYSQTYSIVSVSHLLSFVTQI